MTSKLIKKDAKFLQGVSIPQDFVLVQLNRGNDEVIINKGTENEAKLYLHINEGNQGEHAPVFGTVEKVCKTLTPNGTPEWETTIEVSPGDEVIMYYLDVVDALGGYSHEKGIFEETNINGYVVEDKVYIFVRYSAIYCVVNRNRFIKPVNGWIIAEKIAKPQVQTKSGLVIGIDDRGNAMGGHEFLKMQARVIAVSSPVKYTDKDKYGDKVYPDDSDSLGANITPGTIVYLDNKHRMADLEYDIHNTAGKNLVYFQRRHILATTSQILDEPV